jgi:hypothetical protein
MIDCYLSVSAVLCGQAAAEGSTFHTSYDVDEIADMNVDD